CGIWFIAGADLSSQTLPTPNTPHLTSEPVNFFMLESRKRFRLVKGEIARMSGSKDVWEVS
ncbi:hypothetical protein, partial [Christiangramia aquimixticola]|uniref:hypothetical protein n=1 Tax=Christiangramia aquimixticola TaxID=1697558 RepID=UPI003AA8D3A1